MNSDVIGPINLGNPEEFTILEVGNLIKKELNLRLNLYLKNYLKTILLRGNQLLK